MPYTSVDAQDNMESLIAGLQEKYDQLKVYIFTPGLTPTQQDIINNLMVKLLMEIHSKSLIAAFNAAAVPVVREPTPTETSALQTTLQNLGKAIDSLTNFQAVVKFVEDVMTQNAQRFTDILKTIQV